MNTATTSNESQTPKSADGMAIGQSSTDLVGFWGATPIARPSGAAQAAVTDGPGHSVPIQLLDLLLRISNGQVHYRLDTHVEHEEGHEIAVEALGALEFLPHFAQLAIAIGDHVALWLAAVLIIGKNAEGELRKTGPP